MDWELGRDIMLAGCVCLTVATQVMSKLHLSLKHGLVDLLLNNEASLSLVLNELIVKDADKGVFVFSDIIADFLFRIAELLNNSLDHPFIKHHVMCLSLVFVGLSWHTG